MGWHLRSLPRCTICGRPATEELYNAVNAPSGRYCNIHSGAALRKMEREYEEKRRAEHDHEERQS